MRVSILAVGSRGDVQPFIALGRGLQSVGYAVRLAALAPFGESVRQSGLEFFSVGSLPEQFQQQPRHNPLRFHGLAGRTLFWLVYGHLLRSRLQKPRRLGAQHGVTARGRRAAGEGDAAAARGEKRGL